MSDWTDKRVLVTGICGTVGRELLRQLVAEQPVEIIGIDNTESDIFFLGEEYSEYSGLRFMLGDIRDGDLLKRAMQGIDVVFHTAALKHVIVCEKSPGDAVKTNILGVQNVIDAASENGVKRVLFTSSDKAVNPTSVMGTSKLMGERLMTAANCQRRGQYPVFASTRFGNVLGSRGSVVPVFRHQISRGGPVTLTHGDMTRFIMTIGDAVGLVMESVFLAQGGEVFVTKMPVARIPDLARVMIDELAPQHGYEPQNIEVLEIGMKPGEKMYEELISHEEVRRTFELDHHYVVLPTFQAIYEDVEYRYSGMRMESVELPYNSETASPLSMTALREYLGKCDKILGGAPRTKEREAVG